MESWLSYNPKLKELARKLRSNSTLAEILLWKELKQKKLGVDFHRQKPIGSYIVDFYCPELELVIEIDGISHEYKLDKDSVRQKYLESLGLRFLRFLDEDVKKNLEGVVNEIQRWIERSQSI